MDTIFNRLIRGEVHWPAWEGALLTWPRMDVCETEDGYLLEMDLPGVALDDVHVEVTGDELVVTGGESSRSPATSATCVSSATSVNLTSRPADHSGREDKIEAHYQDGVLAHQGPQEAAHAKPRKIPVKS